SCNRGKRSIALDFSMAAGAELVRDLARDADVLVENYRPGTLARYGLDHAALRAINPRLIYCSISGYGRISSLAKRAGYDSVIQAEGGLISICGERDGPPVKVGVSIADLLSGMNAVQAILAALIARGRTGEGQFIDISLLDGVVAVLANLGAGYLIDGRNPGRWGTEHPNLVPCQAFPVKDGEIVLVIGNDRQFSALCAAMALPEIADDPRYRTNRDRVLNRDTLLPLLKQAFAKHSRADWLARLHDAGLPAGAIRSVSEVLSATEVRERDMVVRFEHISAGEIELVGSPLKLTGTPVRYDRPPPILGEHTHEVLAELGVAGERLSRLVSEGAIAAQSATAAVT
ncbi:MAG: CoA transferase, partial [Sphingomonadaceae bacterium]|nr:CoA transferase [Sphingomonadaceae bacterium]